MSLNTHNIVAPSTWPVYDMIDRPLPRKTGLYPDPEAVLPQPTNFYVMNYPNSPIRNFDMRIGTLTTATLSLKDIRDPQNIAEVVAYLVRYCPQEFVYNPTIQLINVDEHRTLSTADKLVTGDIEIQGPPMSITQTVDTDGYTVSIGFVQG